MAKKTFELTEQQRRMLGSLIAHTTGSDCLDSLFDELFDEFGDAGWHEVVLMKRDGIKQSEVLVINGRFDNLLKVKS